MNGNAERRLARRAVLGVIALVGSLVTIGVSSMPAQAGTYQLPATVPGAPRDVRVSTGVSGQVTVSWSDPASSGSSDIAGFKVQWKSGDEDYDTTADSARAVFLSGILYWFSGICDRTAAVRAAILGAISGVSDCAEVTLEHLAGIRGTLDLSTNSDLRAVQAQDFRYLVNLQKLDLSFNSSIRSLPGGIFDDLSNLRSLRLTHDGLGSLPAGVFDSLTNLEYLNLTYNDLRALPGGVFDNLSSLRTLTLGANDLSSLPTRPARDRNSW